MRLLPEIELLTLCARPRIEADTISRIRDLLQENLDWQLIFHVAEIYRSIPLVAMHLSHHAMDLVAIDIQRDLQNFHRTSTQHNMALAIEVLRLIKLLQSEGLRAIPFKGPVSAIRVYDDMAMRACGDIDLLVPKADHAKVERFLENQDYCVKVRFQNAMQSSLWSEQRRISIDLHWGIPPERLKIASTLLWEALEPIHLLGQSVLTLSPCDTLLVTAINAVKEYRTPSLHHLSDIAALTIDYTSEDWTSAFKRAKKMRCQRMLVTAMLFANRLLDSPLPSVGPIRLFRHPGITKVVDELEYNLLLYSDEQEVMAGEKPVMRLTMEEYYAALTDSNCRRCSYWFIRGATPNIEDRNVVKLPKALSVLYFFIRPFRLLAKKTVKTKL